MPTNDPRRSRLMCLVDGALRACAPQPVIETAVGLSGDMLTLGDMAYDLSDFDRVEVVGAGKASAAMAQALKGIVAWHKELAPAGESTVVFRDNGFADDVAKTNLTAILHPNGLTNVRSL